MHPGVAVGEVGRGRGVDVVARGGVGQAAIRERVLEGFQEIVDGGLPGLRGRDVWGVQACRLVGVGGEEADGLGHAGLKEACVRRVQVAVDGEDLAKSEEGGQGSVLEADVVGAEAPAEVPGLKGQAEWEDAPY